MNRVFSILLVCNFFVSCKGQPANTLKQGVVIDSTIKKEVERFYNRTGTTAISNFDVTILENDQQKDIILLTGRSVPHYAVRNLRGDSLILLFTNITGAGFGLSITLTSDTCIVRHLVSLHDEERVFRVHPDSMYKPSIMIPGKFYLVLNKRKPDSNETTYGYIECTSDEYYEKSATSDIKRKVKYKGYFKISTL